MKTRAPSRLRFLLGLLLLVFGADQAVALAQEIRTEGETGHAWRGATGARTAPGSVLPDGSAGAAALPAGPVAPPEPVPTTRPAAAPAPRRPLPSRGAPRRAYPRGPPRTT